MAPPLGQQRHRAWLQYPILADDPFTTEMLPCASRVVAQRIGVDAHRVRVLERLDRGVEGIAHSDVHTTRTISPVAGALSAAKRLVEGPPRSAERDVVHGSLPLRGHGSPGI